MSQKKHTKSTGKNAASVETFEKDIGKRIFVQEWIPIIAMRILRVFCIYMVLFLIYHFYFTEDFIIRDYILRRSFFYNFGFILGFVSIFDLFDVRKEYRLLKEKPFASISNEKLILNFGKDSFLWDHIQSVDLEGERKLIVVFKDNGKHKKRIADLEWLSRKKDFIDRLKNNCVTENIRYKENEMTFSSRAGLFLKSSLG